GIVTMAAPPTADEDSMAYATRGARRIEQAHPSSPPDSGGVAAWEQEGLRLAQTVAYGSVTRGAAPSAIYEGRALAVAEDRMALAGRRLATLLNATLK